MADISKDAIVELVDLGRLGSSLQQLPDGGVPFVVIPATAKVQDFSALVEERLTNPRRKIGTAKVLDASSFNEYFTLFRDENSRIFADETATRIVGVLDYHEVGEGKPRFGQHRVELALRFSEEWSTWGAKDGNKQTQMDFAEFLEDNAPDVVSPDAATMREVATDLRAKTDSDFGSAIRVQNGSVKFGYSEQTKGTFGKGDMEIPERFLIAIPVYIGTERVQLTARLRYRINGGKLTFWYDLLRAEQASRDAFAAIYDTIADSLQVKIINGSSA